MEESLEEFGIGLEECEVEASPDFDEQPNGPPAKKARRRKVATKKERERLVTEIRSISLTEISSSCLDKTQFKLTEHTNQLVLNFALEVKPDEVFFVVRSLKVCLQSCMNTVPRKRINLLHSGFSGISNVAYC